MSNIDKEHASAFLKESGNSELVIIIADEPTGNLDSTNSATVLETFLYLAKQ